MRLLAHLCDTQTGETGVYENDWTGYDLSVALYCWREGNYSCDCNRRLFLWRTLHPGKPADDEPDFPCGDGGVRVEKLVDADSGRVVAETL